MRRFFVVVALLVLWPAGLAWAQTIEHATVETVFAVDGLGGVSGVSDDDRYILVQDAIGTYRLDVTTRSRVRVDVDSGGNPLAPRPFPLALSPDGSRALLERYVGDADEPQLLIRGIDAGVTTAYDIPDPQPTCPGSEQIE